MQKYIIENCDSFNPKHIFECGQCFRWNKEDDASYTGVFGKNVLNVRKEENKIIIEGICENDIKKSCEEYFDLERNYETIKMQLAQIDKYLAKSIENGKGIRILNQDLWETIISFIISANNNIPRIKGIIEKLSQNYGNEIIYKNKLYYTFPTVEQLGKASVEDLRRLGLGFRDKRVYDTTKMILNNEINLDNLKKETNLEKTRENLMKLPGVGEKVADCIMLFSLRKLEVFPIDVWVRRVINELYIKNIDENKVTKKEIRELAQNKYGNLAGIAQQYLFYWRRNVS